MSAYAPPHFDPKAIIAMTAQFYRRTPAQVLGKSRGPSDVMARHVAIHLMRKHTQLVVTEIGRMFDRHYATIIYAAKTVTKQIEAGDEDAIKSIAAIESDLERVNDMQTSDGT